MKKILFAAVAALAITGCSQNEEFDAASQKAEIGFKTVVSKATRASELTTNDLKTNGGYTVHAYNTAEVDMDTEVILPATAFMDAVKVTWVTDKWTFDPAGPFYWPTTDQLQFFAYSPTDGITYSKPAGTDKGYPTFAYTIGDVAGQKDLVVAHAKNQTKSDKDVALSFKHVLAQINFALKGKDADFTYKVTGISLSGINNAGVYTFDDPEISIGNWSSTSGDATYAYAATYPVSFTSVTLPADIVIKTGNNSLMLMPQTLGDTAKITIAYSTVYGGVEVFNGTKEVSLKNVEWKAGNKILYTLSLPGGAEDVTLTPTVDGWNNENSQDKEAQ